MLRPGTAAAVALVAALGALLSGGGALAAQGPSATNGDPPVVHTTHHEYDVEGQTARQVLAALRKGARVVDGDSAFAWTESRLEYRTSHVVEAGGCLVEHVHVRAELTVSLPRWRPSGGVPHSLRQQWNRFLRSLRIHEDGHVRIARRGAARLRSALGDLRARDCDTLERKVKREGQAVLDRLQREQRDYDERTGHGRTQGAVWRLSG